MTENDWNRLGRIIFFGKIIEKWGNVIFHVVEALYIVSWRIALKLIDFDIDSE